MNRPIHVAIDSRPLSRNSSGIKRYLECLLEHLVNTDSFRFSLYSDGVLSEKYQHGKATVDIRIAPGKSKFSKLLWQYHVHRWLQADRPDLYFSPRHHLPLFMTNSIPTIVTIHDVIWKSHPQTMRANGLLNEKFKMPYAIRHADRLICPSQATANKIIEFWPDSKEKISVITHGMTVFSENIIKPSTTKPYFLAVGTIEPRKNYARLIEAFDQWAHSNLSHDLIIVGNKAWGWPQVSEVLNNCANRQRIHHIDGVDDNELAGYYQHAAGFIQVSLEEGFGMPIAEARQFGLPQVLSDIPVFKEFHLDEIVWVDPLSVDSIQNGLTKIKMTKPLEPENILASWSKVCEEMYSIFRFCTTDKK